MFRSFPGKDTTREPFASDNVNAVSADAFTGRPMVRRIIGRCLTQNRKATTGCTPAFALSGATQVGGRIPKPKIDVKPTETGEPIAGWPRGTMRQAVGAIEATVMLADARKQSQ